MNENAKTEVLMEKEESVKKDYIQLRYRTSDGLIFSSREEYLDYVNGLDRR